MHFITQHTKPDLWTLFFLSLKKIKYYSIQVLSHRQQYMFKIVKDARNKSLNVWCLFIKIFCTKLKFVWINGYDFIHTLHLMILKMPHQKNIFTLINIVTLLFTLISMAWVPLPWLLNSCSTFCIHCLVQALENLGNLVHFLEPILLLMQLATNS